MNDYEELERLVDEYAETARRWEQTPGRFAAGAAAAYRDVVRDLRRLLADESLSEKSAERAEGLDAVMERLTRMLNREPPAGTRDLLAIVLTWPESAVVAALREAVEQMPGEQWNTSMLRRTDVLAILAGRS